MLGVDAGNTKTIALVARPDGTIVGAARGGCGDIYSVFKDLSVEAAAAAAVDTLASTAAAALREAGIAPPDLLAGGFSLAGADWPEDIAYLRAAMEGRGLGRRIVVVNDAIGALRAGSPDGTGVAIVCGTGVAIGARAGDGRLWHTSHWGEALGAHQMGRQVLRAVYRAELGIDRPTTLTARVLEHFGQPSVEDLLHLLTARERRVRGGVWVDPGRLAPVLLAEAQGGDPVAARLVREHGETLGDYALAAARRVSIADAAFTLVLAGGVLRARPPLLVDAIVGRVRAASPRARPVFSRFEPAVGALLLALEAGDIAGDEPLLERIDASLPSPILFSTVEP